MTNSSKNRLVLIDVIKLSLQIYNEKDALVEDS